ncbi:MAG: hypothetical protein ACUVSV_11390, partial [Armatimonadota bacterium]
SELTKQFEEPQTASISECLAHFQQTPPLGEITLILLPKEPAPLPLPEDPLQVVQDLVAQGIGEKEALKETARRTGISRRTLYALWLKGKRQNAGESISES